MPCFRLPWPARLLGQRRKQQELCSRCMCTWGVVSNTNNHIILCIFPSVLWPTAPYTTQITMSEVSRQGRTTISTMPSQVKPKCSSSTKKLTLYGATASTGLHPSTPTVHTHSTHIFSLSSSSLRILLCLCEHRVSWAPWETKEVRTAAAKLQRPSRRH